MTDIGLYFRPVMECIAALYYYNRYILNYHSILLTSLGPPTSTYLYTIYVYLCTSFTYSRIRGCEGRRLMTVCFLQGKSDIGGIQAAAVRQQVCSAKHQCLLMCSWYHGDIKESLMHEAPNLTLFPSSVHSSNKQPLDCSLITNL